MSQDKTGIRLGPFVWGGAVLVLSQVLSLFIAYRQALFIEEHQIPSPEEVSLVPVLGFFFGAVVVFGVILFLVPLKVLRIILRALFAVMFGWGLFVLLGLTAPLPLAYSLALAAGIGWLFWARVWLHNLLLVFALAAAGSVFGLLFSPWTFIAFMLIIAVYDVVAVRFGYMLWMAEKLSESDTLPGFIFPRRFAYLNMPLKQVRVGDLKKEEPEEREYAILGGGDIGFPLMLAVSVYFTAGLASAVVVSIFALAGLMSAFLIQMLWLKGKPMPALPPIAAASLLGFLVASILFG